MNGPNIWRSLRSQGWLEQLPDSLRNAALSMYGFRAVHTLQRAMLTNAVQVQGTVFTRDRGDVSVYVEATGFQLAQIRCECSCPVQRNCKHAYAVLLAGLSDSYRPRDDLPQPAPGFSKVRDRPLRGEAEPAAPPEKGKGGALAIGVPEPVVRLFCQYPFTGYAGWYSGVPYGEEIRLITLNFTYAEAPGEEFPFGGGPPSGEGWRRDLSEERACYFRLTQLGLKRCGDVMNFSLRSELRDALVFHPISQAPWLPFLTKTVPALEADGWQVVHDETFDLRVLQPDKFYSDTHEGEKAGWFSADIGVEVDGKRIPLLPLIIRYLQSQPDNWKPDDLLAMGDEPVLIQLEDRRTVVPLPPARLHRVLATLTELLNAGAKLLTADGRLELHRLRAAALVAADDDDPDVFHHTAPALVELIERLRSGGRIPDAAPPAGLRAELRPYQLEGYRWLRFLSVCGLGGILADDMGLGKTLQTLAHLLAEVESGAAAGRPSLIVCPTSVVHNWQNEAARFCPALSVHIHSGARRAGQLAHGKTADLIITSYPLLVRDAEVLAAIPFHCVVLDEAQYIKNSRTRASDAARGLDSRLRLCLTGTPMENHLGELWSILHFLLPGYLGNREEFQRLFRNPIEKEGDDSRRSSLARRIAPVFLRRTKQAVLQDLPPRIDILHRVTLHPGQADLYESVRALMDERIHAEIERRGIEHSQIIVLDALLKLRQICCHPQLLKVEQAAKVKESAKLDLFLELVTQLVEEGRRILVFSQFVEMLKLLSASLTREGIHHVQLTGATKDRASVVADFQAGAVPVFLISLKAGGTGLNLTTADTVIHYDPWWNPAVEAQATDRAHRFGQQNTVFVHKIICEGTIEDKILALQQRKAALVQALLGSGSGAGGQSLTAADLEELLAPLPGRDPEQ